MGLPLEIRERAVEIAAELKGTYWREGRQPNRFGLEYLRNECAYFGIPHRIEQGDGRKDATHWFVDPSLDYKVVPWEKLSRLNEAAQGNRVAQALCGLVFWPCDIDQFEPHGKRGYTLIPHQLALAEAGYRLEKQGDDLYLPEGFQVWDVPSMMSNPSQLSLL